MAPISRRAFLARSAATALAVSGGALLQGAASAT
jgi:anaerobic selenocysteine-containing dehydrogenase